MLVVHEQTKKALKAGFLYFIMCITGAYFMQFGILALCSKLGTFDMSAVSGGLHSLTPELLIAAVIMFVIGTGVVIGLVPMNSWFSDAHSESPAPVSFILSGTITTIGIYGLIRILFTVFGLGLLTQLGSIGKLSYVGLAISLLGLLTLFYGEIMALLQTNVIKLLAYSTLGQIGEIVVAIGAGTYLGMVGGFNHIINHVIMKGLLFLAAGILAYRLKSQNIEKFKGIGKVMPFTSGCLAIGALAIMGLPPFNGFISKFLMLYDDVEAGYWYFAALMLLASVISAIYYMRLIKTMFFEKYEGPKVKEGPITTLIPLCILTCLVIFNGLFPEPVLNLAKSAANYVAAQGKIEVTAIPGISITWPVIIIIPMIGGLLAYFLGRKSPKIAGWTAVIGMTAASIAIAVSNGKYDIYSMSFALLIAGVGVLNLLYSLGYMSHGHAQNRYYMFFMLMIGGLIGVATSNSFFTFFIFWEIMSSWTLYFVIIHEETQDALKEGFKYFVFNYIGASIALLGMLILTVNAGTFDMKIVSQRMANLPVNIAGWALVLMTIGFLMKAAAMPFRIDYQMHPATAPTPVSGYISSVLLKSAPFWIIKLFFILGGAAVIGKLGMVGTQSVLMYVVSWIAGLTIIGAAAMALIQKGIKRLLIYSSVSQIGYIILGLSLGSTLGLSGSLLHLVNHMFFKNLLFLAAGAIMVQAHAHNLDEAEGLGRKMPYTMTFFMIGAMSLAGIPPFSGFTSKWIIYEAAMEKGQVFLALLSLVGSVLTMAYFIKFLHSAFFGTLPKKLENVKEAPWTMLLPMGTLSVLCLLFGIMPGLPLNVISKILKLMNITSPEFTLFGVKTPLGAWQVGVILILMLFALVLGIIFFLLGNRKVRYTNTYACGVSDLEDDEIRMASQNMYESPDNVIKKLHKTLIEPIFGNGEEDQK
jgi:formate hydrogenlyase subunit 3/multisubunit Na+/H+ antiporter MnhD subunit